MPNMHKSSIKVAEILKRTYSNEDTTFIDRHRLNIYHHFKIPVSQPLCAHACGAQEIYKSDLKVHGTRGKRSE